MIRFKFVIRLTDFNFQLADRDARNQLARDVSIPVSAMGSLESLGSLEGPLVVGANRPKGNHGTMAAFHQAGGVIAGKPGLAVSSADRGRTGLAAVSLTGPAACSAVISARRRHHDLVDRLRKLEAANQAILDRLDRSERERQRSDERYRTLESRYEELRKRIGQNPEPPSSPSTVPGNRAQPPSENEASGVAHGRDNPEKPNGLSRAFADTP